MLDALATAVLLVDSADCVEYMNPAAEVLLGVSVRRAFARSIAGLVPGFEVLQELCAHARERQRSFGRAFQAMAPHRDGSELDIVVKVSPFEEGQSRQLLIELFDITQRHQLDRENTLVAQHGVSRRMLQQLAHEIRNPLGGLRGAAQLLEAELDKDELREFTQVIIGEADRLEGLVAGLLGPGERPDLQPANVHEVLEHVAMLVQGDAPNLELLRDYDPSLPPLLMDRDQVTQALLNLMRNASQATDGQGSVMLRTRVRANHVLNARRFKLVVVIDIEDNGPGVPDEIAGTIFYPLVSGRKDGSGIGLPLAQELINRHNGLIEFVSQPGQTVFSVSVPILPEEPR